MSSNFKPLRLVALTFALVAPLAWAAELPRIAVTDLSYEEKVSEYFSYIDIYEKYDKKGSSRERSSDTDSRSSGSSSDKYSSKGERSLSAGSGYQERIDRGEMRKYVADVKGEMIKAGYRLVQGKPWTQKNTEKLYDIIDRVKQGYYPGADYVLFGTINNVEFRRDDNPIQGSNATSHTLALELVGEFSLISTKTFDVKASFSAMGEGSDMKMTNAAGTNITLNRSKVMQQVSKSLGEAVLGELQSQFNPGVSSRTKTVERTTEVIEEKTTVYK